MNSVIDKLSALSGDKVVSELLRIANNLPTCGLAAGQAVSSVVTRMLGLNDLGVVNDIDVFQLNAETAPRTSVSSEECAIVPGYIVTPTVGSYGGLYSAFHAAVFIAKVENQGVVNLITCDRRVEATAWFEGSELGAKGELIPSAQPVLPPIYVLSSFDLNCVQVGVDLSTKQMYWTPAFEQFLKTKELQIVNPSSPVRSLVRAFKKATEMPSAFLNKQAAIEVAKAAYTSIDLSMTAELAPSPSIQIFERVGPTRAAAFKEVEDELGEHFALKPISYEGSAYAFVLNSPLDPDLFATTQKLLTGNGSTRETMHWFTFMQVYPRAPAVRNRIERALGMSGARDWALRMLQLHGLDFFDVDFTNVDILRAVELIQKHTIGLDVISKLSLILDAVCALRALDKIEKGLMLRVIGLCEMGKVCPYYVRANGVTTGLTTQEMYTMYLKVVEEVDREMPSLLLESDSVVVDGFHFRQLRSVTDIMTEGSLMEHCVGGYAFGPNSQKAALFAVTNEALKLRVTVQCTYSLFEEPKQKTPREMIVNQCYRRKNRSVEDIQVQVALELALQKAVGARASILVSRKVAEQLFCGPLAPDFIPLEARMQGVMPAAFEAMADIDIPF